MDERVKGWLVLSVALAGFFLAVPWIWRTDAFLLVVLVFLAAPLAWLVIALMLFARERVLRLGTFAVGAGLVVFGFIFALLGDPIVGRWIFESKYANYRKAIAITLADRSKWKDGDWGAEEVGIARVHSGRIYAGPPLVVHLNNEFGPTLETTIFTPSDQIPTYSRRKPTFLKKDELGYWYIAFR